MSAFVLGFLLDFKTATLSSNLTVALLRTNKTTDPLVFQRFFGFYFAYPRNVSIWFITISLTRTIIDSLQVSDMIALHWSFSWLRNDCVRCLHGDTCVWFPFDLHIRRSPNGMPAAHLDGNYIRTIPFALPTMQFNTHEWGLSGLQTTTALYSVWNLGFELLLKLIGYSDSTVTKRMIDEILMNLWNCLEVEIQLEIRWA